MKLNELVINEMGIYGKKVRLTAKAKNYPGEEGKIIEISSDHLMYYIEFDEGQGRHWIQSTDIEGFYR